MLMGQLEREHSERVAAEAEAVRKLEFERNHKHRIEGRLEQQLQAAAARASARELSAARAAVRQQKLRDKMTKQFKDVGSKLDHTTVAYECRLKAVAAETLVNAGVTLPEGVEVPPELVKPLRGAAKIGTGPTFAATVAHRPIRATPTWRKCL